MKKKIFVTGISTDVGKTVVSAIIAEALQADYWKPIQAGDLDNPDSHKIKRLVTNTKTRLHNSSYALKTAMSPHAAAALDGLNIDMGQIIEPITKNHLVIEGAGGLLVPINNKETILDLIKPDYKVIVVSKHYLGSINHTLLTIEMLKLHRLTISGIVFNGEEHPSTENIIKEKTGIPVLGRLENEPFIDKNVVKDYAEMWQGLFQNI